MIAVVSTQALWYLTRGSGVVTFILLSGVLVLGLATARRTETARWPRFAIAEIHRRLSLSAVVFLAIHVATAVSDPFAPIGWLTAIVPFVSSYRPLWLGLGTLAVDLFLAILATSLLRHRLNERLWRAVHWLAYLSWPIALFHSLGTGSDVRSGWLLAVIAVCVGAVLVALALRLGFRWPERAGARLAGAGAAVAVVVAGAAFVALGPLQANWAKRAGTPTLQSATSASSTSSAGGSQNALPNPPYEASVSGTVTSTALGPASEQISIRATTSGAAKAALGVDLIGAPDGTGGVVVQRTSATYGPTSAPDRYSGSAVAIAGSHLTLALSGSGGQLTLDLRLNLSGSSVSGTLRALSGSAAPVGGVNQGGDDGGE